MESADKRQTDNQLPTISDVRRARGTIAPVILQTPVLQNKEFNGKAGGQVFFKCESFQRTGSFKLRGASNVVFNLCDEELANGVATASSGNHGQALAFVAKVKGIPSHIVVPKNAPEVKKRAMKGYGARLTLCEPTYEDRQAGLEQVITATGSTFVPAYDHPDIIAGQGTAALELLEEQPDLDLILVPVGGGGLLSGTAIAAKSINPQIRVIGCEPELADDAFRSLQTGKLQPATNKRSCADGLLTSLSELTFSCIQKNVDAIVTVSERQIIEAMHHVWERLKIVIEPSAAVPIAAVLNHKAEVEGKKAGVIVSGGNVDLDRLLW